MMDIKPVCHVTHLNLAKGLKSEIFGEVLVDGDEFVKSSVRGLTGGLVVLAEVDDSGRLRHD